MEHENGHPGRTGSLTTRARRRVRQAACRVV
jgi:hypothetical protein